MIGIGVMISELSGNGSSVDAYKASLGKTISSVEIADDKLRFAFTDGATLTVFDDGQSCCEHRYMKTDDDLSAHIGEVFSGIEIKDAPDVVGEYGECHEVQFLEVKTDKDHFTVATHNEHNGYYGGFSIRCAATGA